MHETQMAFAFAFQVISRHGTNSLSLGDAYMSRLTLRPRQNGRLFANDAFKRIFLNENNIISIQISQKFVPKGLINNIPALVLIMAWSRPGDKPLSESMMVRSLTDICVTRPQWVNILHRTPKSCRWLVITRLNWQQVTMHLCHLCPTNCYKWIKLPWMVS